jgi:hypothetical protein
VIGNIAAPVKGEQNYVGLVRLTLNLPVEWHFFGERQIDGLKDLGGDRIHFHGGYRREDIADLLVSHEVDVCVILPNVDETFSYVLSEALSAGVPVLATAKGSLPERIEESRAGVIVNDVQAAYQWIERACADRNELEQLAANARAARQVSTQDNANAYLGLYRKHNLLASVSEEIAPKGEVLRELIARSTVTDPVTQSSGPVPRYQKSRWYPAFRSIKTFIPAPIRKIGRAALVESERLLSREHSPDSSATENGTELIGMRLIERRKNYAVLEVSERPASIMFEPKLFRPESVDNIQLTIRRRSPGESFIRLLWVHSFDEGFTDEKSLTIRLGQNSVNKHLLRLRELGVKRRWCYGAEIVKLRLDVVIEPGICELGPLEFGAFALSM